MDKITDYDTLKAAVAGMAHRDSSTAIVANVPLFIQLFEAEAYDELLLKDMESDEALTLTAGQNYVALPAGFVAPIALWLVVNSVRCELDQVMPHELPYDASSNQPSMWAVDGENVRFDCPASSAFSARLRCRKSSALSDSNDTNYLLLKRPDVYLWGSMKHMAIFMQDEAGIQKYGGLCEAAKKRLQEAEARHQALVPLRSDFPFAGQGRADIRRGN